MNLEGQWKGLSEKYLCFPGCMVVPMPWYPAVLASMAVCTSFGNHLAMPHFRTSCTRLPKVSQSGQHMFIFTCDCIFVLVSRGKCLANNKDLFTLKSIFQCVCLWSLVCLCEGFVFLAKMFKVMVLPSNYQHMLYALVVSFWPRCRSQISLDASTQIVLLSLNRLSLYIVFIYFFFKPED